MSTHEHEKALEQEVAPQQAQAVVEDPQRALPPQIWNRLMHIQAGDAQALVDLVRQNPDFSDAILTQAASTASIGNRTVSAAIDLLAAAPVTEAAPSQEASPARGRPIPMDFSAEGFDYKNSPLLLEGGDVVGDHVKFIQKYPYLRHKVEQGFFKATLGGDQFDELLDRLNAAESASATGPSEKEITEKEAAAETKTGSGVGNATEATETARPKAETSEETHNEKESAWIVNAKRFNTAHPEEVAEFNRVTKDACLGHDGNLDPKLVSDWQASHGIAPDGRVGPATVDAARRANGIGHPIPITDEALGDLE